jgi:hypothetical protein
LSREPKGKGRELLQILISRDFEPRKALGGFRCLTGLTDLACPPSKPNARAIVMDNADSSLNLRTIVPSPRDLGQAAAR